MWWLSSSGAPWHTAMIPARAVDHVLQFIRWTYASIIEKPDRPLFQCTHDVDTHEASLIAALAQRCDLLHSEDVGAAEKSVCALPGTCCCKP